MAGAPLVSQHLSFFRLRPRALHFSILFPRTQLLHALSPNTTHKPIIPHFSPRYKSTSLTSTHINSTTTTPTPVLYHEDDDEGENFDEEEEEYGEDDYEEEDDDNEFVTESEQNQDEGEYPEEELGRSEDPPEKIASTSSLPPPKLSVKEKKELASYAHSLGKKLKAQQVGKAGVTPSLAAAFVENLESNELLKLKVHNNCPGELADVVRQLEEATGSVAVGQIGRSVILYRPSLSKMKAAEKKKQHLQKFKKGFTLRPRQPKGELPMLSGRGRRGSSRVK